MLRIAGLESCALLICLCYCLTVLLAFWHNCCLLVFSLALKPVFSSRSLRPQIWIQATSFWGVTLSRPSWSTEVGSKWCVFGLSKLIRASLIWSDIQVFPVWKVSLHCSDTGVMTLYTGVMFNVHALLRLLWNLVSGSCFLWVSTSWLGFDSPHWVTLKLWNTLIRLLVEHRNPPHSTWILLHVGTS